MPYTCDKCQYEGYGKFKALSNFRIPIAALLFIFPIGYFANPYNSIEQHHTFSYVVFFGSLLLISLILFITYYRSHRYSCPKCNYGHMVKPKIGNTERNTQSGVLKLCTICNHIGYEIRKNYLYAILPILFIINGSGLLIVVIIFFATNEPSKYFVEIISEPFVFLSILYVLFILTIGIYSFKTFWRGKDGCPNCKNRQTMIPLDTPRAQALIQEHNLTVPTSTLPEITQTPNNPLTNT